MKKVFTNELLDYIREVAPGNYTKEIAELVNAKFGTNFTKEQIKNCLSREKIRNGMYGSHKKQPWNKMTTPEMDEFIKANNYLTPAKDMARMVNEKFGTNFTAEQIKCYRSRYMLDSGLTGYFPKGNIPPNKDKKMSAEAYAKAAPTMFKKGHRPHNAHPVGTERVDSKDGYIYVKIAEPNVWKQKHHILWEEYHGPIPKGHVITFLDGNKNNVVIENLAMITNAENLTLIRNKLRKTDPELTKAGINIAKLYVKSNELKKEKR